MENIGIRLRELRNRTGLSQEYVSQKLGVSLQTISKWENGRSLPEISNLAPIASLFHVSVDELLGIEVRRNEWEGKLNASRLSGKRDEELQLLREALNEFPGDYKFRYQLAELEYLMAEEACDLTLRKRFLILSDIQLSDLRSEQPEFMLAIDLHTKVLATIGRYSDAVKLAKTSPNHERLLLSVLKEDELAAQKKKVVNSDILVLIADLISLGSLSALNKALEVTLLFVNDAPNLLSPLLDIYCKQAHLYCELGKNDLALTAFKKGFHLIESNNTTELLDSSSALVKQFSASPREELRQRFHSFLMDEHLSGLLNIPDYLMMLSASDDREV